jgi:hypothetical protein
LFEGFKIGRGERAVKDSHRKRGRFCCLFRKYRRDKEAAGTNEKEKEIEKTEPQLEYCNIVLAKLSCTSCSST